MIGTPKAPAQSAPVANLRESKRQQAALRQAEAGARQRHPAGSKRPAAKAPAAKKTAPAKATKPAAEVEKRTYSAAGRGGVTNSRSSATALSHAVDVRIAGRRGAQTLFFEATWG